MVCDLSQAITDRNLGKFQSKKALEERKKNGESLRKFFGAEQSENEIKISEALCKVAEEHGIENPTAVALAYVMAKAVNVFPIVGGRKVSHLHENIKSLSIKLSDKQIEYLESVLAFDIGFPMNFIGPDPALAGKTDFFLMKSVNQFSFTKAPRPIGHE